MTEQEVSLVIGGTGVVGSYIVEHLRRNGHYPFALSRSPHSSKSIRWIRGDLERPDTLELPQFATLYCTADPVLLANNLPSLISPSLKRIVVFSSTSVVTKQDSELAAERDLIGKLADAEQRIRTTCEGRGVEWTILRPTLIYAEGRDTNITPLSRLIRRFGFMLLVGGAPGLRQPVHAEDLAIAAISAASSTLAANRTYSLPGGETLTYNEMIGRIFDGLRLPRRTISVPAFLWRALFFFAKPLFPGANVAMGLRMIKDMTFDSAPAAQDFGWNPRRFNPDFDKVFSP
ncbi:NAD-dependent epimerase/dehydratase family protein [Bradyrhizobium sp. 200]|uniref:SDR family oxidoreductase n=1 Tax=Bradyrhizobium sp. 200 TaxID=2782665 RepID=UPI00200032C2|nr:NAD-dependent epimerase/dehydratase family protein [Bradyrhizobium sp. 200]UPJ51995.1 NAD-dependent epimerase/dehydratase family protein [Bradyrhizobium sp. 200]